MLVAEGLTNKQIASQFGTSVRTAEPRSAVSAPSWMRAPGRRSRPGSLNMPTRADPPRSIDGGGFIRA